ncbi:SDR family NAD(P)-dependent oxidoreductase [Hyphococcus luteus]|uniref:NAD(P)-dependent oxidoreductase n=1 Tax=Hyphococcus luteus TaxID=2058213 RepID=A0A2S7K3B8_9PROT|nr:SDR family NAD(P)-dependent oxidoreductase [Marinicaulis flavus]PQA86989.1 NAD(P)-dependent oxidoreductase [Marinicaulis flavus]
MKDVKGKTAFITGGASGIGLGIAKAFYNAGSNLVLADIREDHLKSAEAFFNDPDRVLCLKLDVTDRAAYAAAAKQAEDKFGKIHMLFNNAGMGVGGPLKNLGFDDWDWGLGVMIGGVINGIQIVLPYIQKHGEGGHIVNTSSKAALVPVTAFSIYGTAKAAMVGLSESIRGELAPDNIGVSVFCPGPVQSNIAETGKIRPDKYKKDTGLAEAEEQLAQRPVSDLWMSAEECGERVLKGVQNNDLYILTHAEFKKGAEEHFNAILKSFPDEPINEERAKAISFLLRNPIFDEINGG